MAPEKDDDVKLVQVDQTVRRQRWITNVSLLATMLDSLPTGTGAMLTDSIDKGIAKLKTFLADADSANGQVPVNAKDNELKCFRLESYQSTVTTWAGFNEAYMNQEVLFEVSLLGPLVRNAASVLRRSYKNAKGVGADPDPTDSILFQIGKLAYLNRKICLLAEKGLKEDTLIPLTTTAKAGFGVDVTVGTAAAVTYYIDTGTPIGRLAALFVTCQRVRCSKFNEPFKRNTQVTVKALASPASGVEFSLFSKFFKSELNQDDKPFNPNVHRIRGRSDIGQPPPPPDDAFLSLDAGARKPQNRINVEKSTLGLIAHGLGLPERCDISGTTTDAIGAALLINQILADAGSSGAFDPRAYILCCMTSMCMAGHHSLDEVAAAASLWSNRLYKPFDAFSFEIVLGALCQLDGTPPASGIWLNQVQLSQENWYTQKWNSFLLAKEDLTTITFNNELWRGAKIAAGLFLSK
jgi:hypothetical protein